MLSEDVINGLQEGNTKVLIISVKNVRGKAELTKLTFTKDMLIRKTKIYESLLLGINFDNKGIPRNKRKKKIYKCYHNDKGDV